jgi:hypothetical protein
MVGFSTRTLRRSPACVTRGTTTAMRHRLHDDRQTVHRRQSAAHWICRRRAALVSAEKAPKPKAARRPPEAVSVSTDAASAIPPSEVRYRPSTRAASLEGKKRERRVRRPVRPPRVAHASHVEFVVGEVFGGGRRTRRSRQPP